MLTPDLMADQVVLLDEEHHPIGTAARTEVHTTDTPLHRAFSIYLFDPEGRLLVTRRALTKLTWPGVWTNSCCGHPRPGETDESAIRRRTSEELGLEIDSVEPVLPQFAYTARDASGLLENEFCPVYVGTVTGPPQPDPDEVMDWAWMGWDDVVTATRATPQVYSPWSVGQVAQMAQTAQMAQMAPTAQVRRHPAPGGAPGATDRSASGAAPTLAAVDRLVAAELAELDRLWRAMGPGDDASSTILGADGDLPVWLGRLAAAGGKRIRPAMCHWGFVAAGGRNESPGRDLVVRSAAALELLHLFALIHDDVMDDSDTRRGAPSAHKNAEWAHRSRDGFGDPIAFGRNLAILLGDLAVTEANRLAADLPAPLKREWHRLTVELIVGQRSDLTGAAEGRRDLYHAEFIARLKSGCYTVSRPLRLGALAAGGSHRARAALDRYGQRVGEAFALRDDLLGVWGDPQVTGKPAGDDLRNGKATVVLSVAETRLAGAAAVALRRVGTADARPDDVVVLQQAMVEAGVREKIESMISDRIDAAVSELDERALTPAGVSGLREMAATVAWRQS